MQVRCKTVLSEFINTIHIEDSSTGEGGAGEKLRGDLDRSIEPTWSWRSAEPGRSVFMWQGRGWGGAGVGLSVGNGSFAE